MKTIVKPCSDLVPVPGHDARALKWTLFTAVPGTINVHKQLGKGNNYREISGKFGVVASTTYEKVSTMGADENLFKLVLVPGHGTRVLPLELVPVPRHGAQISARAPTSDFFGFGTQAKHNLFLYFLSTEGKSFMCQLSCFSFRRSPSIILSLLVFPLVSVTSKCPPLVTSTSGNNLKLNFHLQTKQKGSLYAWGEF